MEKSVSQKGMQNERHHHFESHGAKRMLHVVLLVFLLFFLICGIETFSTGVSPIKLYTRVNDTFEISCFVHGPGGKLDFYEGDEFVPENFIKRINDTHIIYRNVYTKSTKKNITCRRGGNNIGWSEIYIDEKFSSIKDLKCRTRDLEELSCNFDQSFSHNPIRYRLYYSINDDERKHCKLEQNLHAGYSCKISIKEIPLNSSLNFMLRAQNDFYKRRENFEIKLTDTVLPEQMVSTRVLFSKSTKNTSSFPLVIFELPSILEAAAKELMFEVKIKPKDNIDWEEMIYTNFEENESKEKFLSLNNVNYANTVYQYKIRMKTKSSVDTDDMWSPYIEGSFKTKPKFPEVLPNVCENCFSINDNGNVFLYWTKVPKFYQNGDNFSYLLKIFNPTTKVLLNETFITKTSFLMAKNKFNIPYLMIQIYSSNHLGLSKNYRTINVYMTHNKNLLRIKKELFDKGIGYKLSWRPYDNIIDIENYTIVWCRQTSELPNQCDSPIRFINLPPYENEFYLNTSQTNQFGIAIRTLNGNGGGIQWAKCTSSTPDEIGTINSLWINYANENSILFEWKVNCADKDIVSAYHIKYCIVADFDKHKCLDEYTDIFNVTTQEQISNNYLITNLKPYRIYNISVSMMSTSGRLGAFSKPLMIRTLEGSPSAPQNLKAIDVQSTYIKLQWSRPLEVNGPSLTYQLWYNDKMIHIDNNVTRADIVEYQLNQLQSFTNYTITIVACTRNCSVSSGSLMLRTKMGKPSRMNQIGIRAFENGSIYLYWDKPSHLGGHLNFYLLTVSEQSAYETKDFLYEIDGHRNSCIISSLNCDKKDIIFSMRGVNVDYSNQIIQKAPINDSEDCFAYQGKYNQYGHYYGDSSSQFDHICGLNYSSILYFLENSPIAFISIILGIILIGFFCNISYKVYSKLQDMKDIKILLPDGLDPHALIKIDYTNTSPTLDKIDLTANLENIKEESFRELELYENDFITDVNIANPINIEKPSSNIDIKEHYSPLISKNQTINLTLNFNKNKKKIKSRSVPTSPINHDSNIDSKTDYVKMYEPQKSITNSISNPSIHGYLDMSRKPSNLYINQNHDVNANSIKAFIRNSQLNNGYIKRNSTKNTNGYVGFKC